MHTIATFFLRMFLVAALLPAASAFAAKHPETRPAAKLPVYKLSVLVQPATESIIATAVLEIPPNQRLHLNLAGLTVTGGLLQNESGAENELIDIHDIFILPPTREKRTLFLSYTGTFPGSGDNYISKDFMALGGLWHPLPNFPMVFALTATLPAGLVAITESDTFPIKSSGNTIHSLFSKPVTNIHLIAGKYELQKRAVRDGVTVHTAFFPEDAALSADYLASAAEFITRYKTEVGPYPYNHFVIAANIMPTGYSMPTMTLLGQTVLRLPFIRSISLGHEIVHAWFGNSVEVDYSEGNWCEGLTAFLADHSYREQAGEGAVDRKETITKYLSYNNPPAPIALGQFRSASHNQPMADSRRAVGYDRGALFFNELRYRIGPERFYEGVRYFYSKYRNSSASWSDIQASFEESSGQDLGLFFRNRLTRPDIPAIAVGRASIKDTADHYQLSLELQQETETPYDLLVPVAITTMEGVVHENVMASEQSTVATLNLATRPLSLTIDPEYQFLRKLDAAEFPPVWSRFLGSTTPLVIAADKNAVDRYQPLLQAVQLDGDAVRRGKDISESELASHDLLFLGTGSPILHRMFGKINYPEKEKNFRLDVRENPFNPGKVAVIVSSDSREQTSRVATRLTHYGKYTNLEFAEGSNVEKSLAETTNGIAQTLDTLPQGLETARLQSFSDIIRALDQTRVIYAGETHTSAADHRLQLRLIEALYQRNPKLAIGMEMFPTSSQEALDRYTRAEDNTDERSFLAESKYFDVWSYDYRFFRDILRFAREKKLMVKGLNLEREIVSEVFKNGGTESLPEDVRKTLPQERDLSLAGYSDQLRLMFGVHAEGGHGSGNVNGFIQAQALWDETMAQNIVRFLNEHPDHRMVVLAGNQHTRKDFGIPPRVARRLPVTQATLLNVYSGSTNDDTKDVADYVFTAEPFDLPELPKIGAVLETIEHDGHKALSVVELTSYSKAAEAGLRAKDILVTVGNTAIFSMSDIRLAMLHTSPGEEIQITVLRQNNETWEPHTMQVPLSLPEMVMPPGHP